ncbi:MAG: acetyl-CoA carboxylase biotin carboxyl carrier protein subunit [Ignavibacteriales bacterium]|nr:acetyl-CoA carboxylase biotin carboxyl carrier protein subunit [Ignavibacteriales bacterium]
MTTQDKSPATSSFLIDDTSYETTVTKKFECRKPYTPVNPREVLCVIPGVIKKIYVHKGQRVRAKEKLFVLEAMKMENEIISSAEGVIKNIHMVESQLVTKGQLLIEFE